MPPPVSAPAFPTPFSEYPAAPGEGLLATLAARAAYDPFNVIATSIFVLAILHTFAAGWFAAWSHRVQHRYDEQRQSEGKAPSPSVAAELLHFLGEVEVVFGLWAVVLAIAITVYRGWDVTRHYFDGGVNFTEPMFVVVIMALAASRPIVQLSERALRRIAQLGGSTPMAWWLAILTVGPPLGSLITEPAAMTICAVLLGRQFYDLQPGTRLKYATLGLLFVNVSIGGTLTHFAAPPVLMVARPWGWDTPFMLRHFGEAALLSIVVSNLLYYAVFRKELRGLSRRPGVPDVEPREDGQTTPLLPVPAWITAVHVAFIAWTVFNSHFRALFMAGFLFFLGFARATQPYQSRIDLRSPLLVGFFLGGLVIHGNLQGWWIAPTLASLSELPLFAGAAVLTAFNDNAMITYLATLVPSLGEPLKVAVVQGAVTGGGLTVIANAPNPAGQALLRQFFNGAVSPLALALGALLPTLVAALIFQLF
jgi:hypothetical protein